MNQLPKLSSGAGREILAFLDFLPTRL